MTGAFGNGPGAVQRFKVLVLGIDRLRFLNSYVGDPDRFIGKRAHGYFVG